MTEAGMRILIGYSCCPLTLEAFERAGIERMFGL